MTICTRPGVRICFWETFQLEVWATACSHGHYKRDRTIIFRRFCEFASRMVLKLLRNISRAPFWRASLQNHMALFSASLHNQKVPFCSRCGSQIPDAANFCGSCGSSAGAAAPVAGPVSEPLDFTIVGDNLARSLAGAFEIRAGSVRRGGQRVIYKTANVAWDTRMTGQTLGQKLMGAIRRTVTGESLFVTAFFALTVRARWGSPGVIRGKYTRSIWRPASNHHGSAGRLSSSLSRAYS